MSVELVYQASKGRASKVRQLLEDGIHPDACNGNGETALFHAAMEGHAGTVKLLLKYGADPNRCSRNGLTPVNAACLNDNVKSLVQLINHAGRLEKAGPEHQEPALVSAHKYHSDKVIKYMTKLRKEARTKHGVDLLDSDVAQRETAEKRKQRRERYPGKHSSIPYIDISELKAIDASSTLLFNAPHVICMNACWCRVPVTVKTMMGKYYVGRMTTDMAVLSQLRHSRIAIMLAACMGPIPEQVCVVLEYFKLGSLHHVLHNTQLSINLPNRVNIFLDVSEGMIYLESKNIVHCYINSYSILLYELFRAKISNFEHSQKLQEDNSGQRQQPNELCIQQHRWMAPEQLMGDPVTLASDVYSFGATFWECLTRKIPWSWLKDETIKQAVCDRTLPVLDDWPNYIQKLVYGCFRCETKRTNFVAINAHLECIKNSGWHIPADFLDFAFDEWYSRRNASAMRTSEALISGTSRKISFLNNGTDEEGNNKIRLMCSRRMSSRAHKQSIDLGLMSMLKIFHHTEKDITKERDVDKYGPEIAEQLAIVRTLRRHARLYLRQGWAKEMTVRRKLEGDFNRVKLQHSRKGIKHKVKKLRKGWRIRRLNMGEKSLLRLKTVAAKYDKSDWAMYTTGQEYRIPHEQDVALLESDDFDEDDNDAANVVPAGGTFIQYQGDGRYDTDIIPPECQAGRIQVSTDRSSPEDDDIVMKDGDDDVPLEDAMERSTESGTILKNNNDKDEEETDDLDDEDEMETSEDDDDSDNDNNHNLNRRVPDANNQNQDDEYDADDNDDNTSSSREDNGDNKTSSKEIDTNQAEGSLQQNIKATFSRASIKKLENSGLRHLEREILQPIPPTNESLTKAVTKIISAEYLSSDLSVYSDSEAPAIDETEKPELQTLTSPEYTDDTSLEKRSAIDGRIKTVMSDGEQDEGCSSISSDSDTMMILEEFDQWLDDYSDQFVHERDDTFQEKQQLTSLNLPSLSIAECCLENSEEHTTDSQIASSQASAGTGGESITYLLTEDNTTSSPFSIKEGCGRVPSDTTRGQIEVTFNVTVQKHSRCMSV